MGISWIPDAFINSEEYYVRTYIFMLTNLFGWWSRVVCVEVVWTYGKNGGGVIGEENNKI